jgi:GNAT superfamily N-acetyltransferase
MSAADRDLDIRPADAKDYEILRDLFKHLIPNDIPMSEDQGRMALNAMLTHPGLTTLIGFHQGQPVSTCTLIVVPNFSRAGAPFALIENVVTHKDHRGKGFGEETLRTAFDTAWSAGCYKIMLLTGATNTKAQKFYRKVGFKGTKAGFELRAPGYPSRQIE